MSDVVIRAEGLGKKYRIGHREAHYETLRESLMTLVKAPARHARALVRGEPWRRETKSIWALRDVDLEVHRGEVLGVIGRNGAGKSTLLKILARITEPTTGRVTLRGRVGSLLEVGTGFHPELTGRENIFLNGAILGMRKAEIIRRFDEIVDFAEIERFLDTPVKRYSSGMHVRLAFAVAAHLDPEVLLLDEVLAVGDNVFQKKCMGRMGDVAREGRTVLFVSHNMSMIANFCDRCVLLSGGTVDTLGDPAQVIEKHLRWSDDGQNLLHDAVFDHRRRENSYTPNRLIVHEVRVAAAKGELRTVFAMNASMRIEIDVEGLQAIPDAWVGAIITSAAGQRVCAINTGMCPPRRTDSRSHMETYVLHIPNIPFMPGTYSVSVSVTRARMHRIDFVERAARFHVEASDVYGSGYPLTADLGVMFLRAEWSIEAD